MRKKRNILLFAMLMSLLFCLPVWADAIGYDIYDFHGEDRQVMVQATDGSGYLYLRSGPGMDYDIICNIYDGTVLTLASSGEDPSHGFRWGSTQYNGQWGWISLKHTVPYEGEPEQKEEKKADRDVIVHAKDDSGYLYLRSGPSMDYEIYCTIHDGEILHITAETPDAGGNFNWGKTVYNGQEGWISLKHTDSYKKPKETPKPTPKPTEEPTPEPTKEVTPEPAKEVTPEPTKTVTPEPAEEPEKESSEEAAVSEQESGKSFDTTLLVLLVASLVLILGAVAALIMTKNKER